MNLDFNDRDYSGKMIRKGEGQNISCFVFELSLIFTNKSR